MINEPLGLPKGSVRAVLAILITLASLVGLYFKPEVSDKIMPALTAVLALYFGGRTNFSNHQ